jgi:hypothetical protein
MPMPQAGAGGQGLSTTGWLAILGTLGGAATAIAVLATRGDDEDGSAAQQQALANLQAISTTAQQTATLAAATTSVVAQADAAIQNAGNLTPAQKAQFTAQAQSIANQALSATQRIGALNATISQLESRISASDSPSASDLAALNAALAELETARQEANSSLGGLQTLITDLNNAGVQNVPPPPTTQPVLPPNVASASVPV